MENISKTFEKHICILCTHNNEKKCKEIIKKQQNKTKTYKCINFQKRND